MRLLVNLFGFLPLSMVDILDILMVGLIIYFLIRLIRNSSAMNIFLALIFLLLVQAVVSAFGMKMMSSIMNTLLDVGVLALIVIFQPEIRHFLNRIGSQTGITRRTSDIFNRLLGIKEDKMGNAAVQEITEACRSMSEQYTGALIVFPHKTSLDYIVETGNDREHFTDLEPTPHNESLFQEFSSSRRSYDNWRQPDYRGQMHPSNYSKD